MSKHCLKIMKRCFQSIAALAIALGSTAALADNGAGAGVVYTMTNDPSGNAVVVYSRAADGTLTLSGKFSTGGTSIGDFATGNQHGLLLSDDDQCLWAVNSLSNQVTAFTVKGTSLSRTNIVGSGGYRPVSIGVNPDLHLLYVLNAGGQVGYSDNVSGFIVGRDCGLSPLANSTRALSASDTSPAQVSFDPTGSVVVVTEKTNNGGVKGGHIDTFIVGRDGRLSSLKSISPPDSLAEPFGFAFDSFGQMLVTVADCHQPSLPGILPGCATVPIPPFAADTPALVSYRLSRDGNLTLVDALLDNQAAKCWIVITSGQEPGGGYQALGGYNKNKLKEFAFTVNALATQAGGTPGAPPAGSVTGYQVSPNGRLTDIGVTPIPIIAAGVPVDASLSDDNRFLYVLSEGDGSISAFKVGQNGGLTLIKAYPVTSTPAIETNGPFPNGLAAR
jgi:hypothetical protein